MKRELRIQGKHYNALRKHLFPGDNKEAVAVILCGRHETDQTMILLSHDLMLIPHDECDRDEQYVRWSTDRVIPFFEKLEKTNLAIVKIHSHPTGYEKFSDVDDRSDALFFPAAFSWSEKESPHASLVMLPDGKIFGRMFNRALQHLPFDKISVAGDEIKIWEESNAQVLKDSFALRTIQAFGDGTYNKLKRLKVAVVGCSGTGSPTIEQLVRLGVGTIVLVDPDTIEDKNLNRIINSKAKDVGFPKVSVLENAIEEIGLGTLVKKYQANLYDSKEAMLELISSDVILGCVDSAEGRHLISQISNFYVIPYFDLGVRLIADGKGGVNTVVGSIHYIQPGMSSLLSRGLYTVERLRAEGLQRTDPTAYNEQVKQKYVQGVVVDRPAVISLNMLISSLAILELLNRLHGFKDEHANSYAKVMVDFCGSCIENCLEESYEPDENSVKWAGMGDIKPFLRMTGLPE